MAASNRAMLLQLARLPPELQNTFVALFTSQLSVAHSVLTDHDAELSAAHRDLRSITLTAFKQTLATFEREMHEAIQNTLKQADKPASIINYSFPSSVEDEPLQSTSLQSPDAANKLASSISNRSPRRINQRSPIRLQPVKEQYSYQFTDDSATGQTSASSINPPIVPALDLPSGSPAVIDALCNAQTSTRSRKYQTAPHDLASMMAEWQASHSATLSNRVLNETASPACSASPSSLSSKSHFDRIHSLSQHSPITDSSDSSDSESDQESATEIRSKRASMTAEPENTHQKFVRGAATMRHSDVRMMMNWMREEANKQTNETKPS